MWKRFQTIKWQDQQPLMFTLLRIGIGWHFLWEGLVKLANPAWTAEGYLTGSWGPFAPLFQRIATLTLEETPILSRFVTEATAEVQWLLGFADFLMPWLLVLAGIGLMLGLFTRAAIVIAMMLLLAFIAAAPSFSVAPTMAQIQELGWSRFYTDLNHAQWAGNMMIGNEGNYFLISKNVIELLALAAMLTIDLRRLYGIDLLFPISPAQATKPIKTADATAETEAGIPQYQQITK